MTARIAGDKELSAHCSVVLRSAYRFRIPPKLSYVPGRVHEHSLHAGHTF